MNINVINSQYAVSCIKARRETGVIYTALNLFMLGFLRQYPEFPKNTIYWCDGLMGKLFMKLKGCSIKRMRGVEMLRSALIANTGRTVCILGSCSDAAMNVLAQYGAEVTQHYRLDSLDIDTFNRSSVSLNSDFVLVTLPSPKQELLSLLLAAAPDNSKKNFFCIGGALNMLSHPELDCPPYLQVLGLEFVFRLRSDTVRRIHRLFNSVVEVLKNLPELAKYKVVVSNR